MDFPDFFSSPPPELARAEEWASLQEPRCKPLFEAALAECRVGEGTHLLDVGCGSGRAPQMVAERGARVAGVDGAPELIEIGKRRNPAGDLRIGEMQELPFDDGAFDVVTGFNAFQCAARHERREACDRRVGSA